MQRGKDVAEVEAPAQTPISSSFQENLPRRCCATDAAETQCDQIAEYRGAQAGQPGLFEYPVGIPDHPQTIAPVSSASIALSCLCLP